MSWKPAHRPASLKLRLALVFGAGSLATLLVALGFLNFGIGHEIHARDRLLLAGSLQDMAGVLTNHPGDHGAMKEEVQEDTSVAPGAAACFRVLEHGRLLIESPGMGQVLPQGAFTGGPWTRVGGRRFLTAERAVGPYRIQGTLEVTGDDRLLQGFRRRLLATLLLLAAGCSLLGVWAAHQGLRPLRSIAATTRGITTQRLRQRLDPADVPRELGELVQAFNAMLDRLDHGFGRLSRFSADLAHELRTPINNLMGETEVVLSRDRTAGEYRRVLESSMEEYRRLSRPISRMLFLARAEDPGGTVRSMALDAGHLVQEVLAFYEALAQERGVALAGAAEGGLWGDRDLLRQALANLVANALDATPEGGRVQVNVKASGSWTDLEVQDDGRGIPPEEVPRLCDRFYRTSDAFARKSPGTGLGLAIVKSIAQLHGGEVRISSQVGAGTVAVLRLPKP
jgi:two-component system heavy metal sensor histidine kinase CusS